MGLFSRKRLSPDFIAVPTEPSAAQRAYEEASERVKDKARIDRINERVYDAFQCGDMAQADRLLDMRLAIRPSHAPTVVAGADLDRERDS